MKKLLTLLFTFAIAFSLAMPVFAQATGGTETPKTTKKKTKKTKTTKEHSTTKAEKKTTAATTQ